MLSSTLPYDLGILMDRYSAEKGIKMMDGEAGSNRMHFFISFVSHVLVVAELRSLGRMHKSPNSRVGPGTSDQE